MTKRIVFYVFTAIVSRACSLYPSNVEQALKLAGDNRAELEKVLEHYRKHREDKLKLQSAYFLIANMPYHFTVHNEQVDSFTAFIKDKEVREGLWLAFMREHDQPEWKKEITPDLAQMTSEYLIRNIDFSFQVWQATPWYKNYSFDNFCEEILPYRVSNEPLEYWKEEYYATFRPVIDSMMYYGDPARAGITLLNHINEQGWKAAWELNIPGISALFLLQYRLGMCKEQADFVSYVMRSVGIPTGIDSYAHTPNKRNQKHFWNYIRNKEGEYTFFDFYDAYIEPFNRKSDRKLGKVYRQYFAPQKESLPIKYDGKFIPNGALKNIMIKDVSIDYFPDTNVSFRIEPSYLTGKNDLAFLCTFNDKDWKAITCCMPRNGIATFRNVEPDILYQIRLINATKNIPVSKPFILAGNENALFIEADTTELQSMRLIRKFMFPELWPPYTARAVNGKFQGANKADFSDSVTLYTIQKPADLQWDFIQLEHGGKYKYVRYLSAPDGYNNMAEIQFYAEGKRLHGAVIGSHDAAANVFDSDPLSYFSAREADGAWAGLQLDKAYRIDAIKYIFRNDDNCIREGDTYELVYQSNGKWLSAGIQTADTTLMYFDNVPSRTLYWLRNHTRGVEERPFTYENGQQIWW